MHADTQQDTAALGLTREDSRYTLLLPLAYVAAASRRRDIPLLDRLIESSARAAGINAQGLEVARGWMRQPPTPHQFEVGLARLRSDCQDGTGGLAMRDLIEAVLWACSAAQLDRERVGRRYTPVSVSARRAIAEIEAALGVDVGDLWADVLEELGDELPRSKNVLPPRLRTGPDSQQSRGGAPPASVPESAPGAH